MACREYHIALQYVKQEYNQLWRYAQDIVVTPSRLFPEGQEGQCSPDRYVSISDGLSTVGQYVNALVHELTHAMQFMSGRRMTEDEMEHEAYEAGILAAERYLTKAAPWRKP